MGFGVGGSAFPFRLGGGRSVQEQEYDAHLKAMSPGYGTSDPLFQIETRALAIAPAIIWAVNRRTENQAIPSKMIEALPDWEEILDLIPAPGSTDQDRRATVGGKLGGAGGNSVGDIETACRALLGRNYLDVRTVADADAVTYWPGVNPGPPGREWSSTRCHLAVAMSRTGLSDDAIVRKLRELTNLLDNMLPATFTLTAGVSDDTQDNDSGFIVNVGIVGQTLL